MTTITPLLERFDADRPILGMVHLQPLPGAPGFDGDRGAVRDRALADAETLVAGGVDGLVLENFGDAPFYPDSVPKHVVAELTAVAQAVTRAVGEDVPIGINVLRNDAEAALSVASAVGAAFVRVNVHVGAAATDQGVLEGRAHETLRLRDRLESAVAVLADVHVKHATPVGDATLERATRETVERGLADGVVVSGPGTGEETELEDLERVVETVDAIESDLERRVPVFVGSGVTSETVGRVFERGADGAIVGTAFQRESVSGAPVVEERVRNLVIAGRK